MDVFETDSERLIVAADFRPEPDENPVEQAQAFLERIVNGLSGLEVTIKINTIARILGARAVELIQDEGLSCFLDLKLLDIKNTIENDAAWITYYEPLMLTVGERVKPSALEMLGRLLPKTLILPVGPLTDLEDDDFVHFGMPSRDAEVTAFFDRISKLGVKGAICAPTDIGLAPQGFRDSAIIVTPAVKPAWSVPDNNSANALTPAKAIRAGASAIVVGRGITAEKNIYDAAARTLEEMREAMG